MNVKNNIFGDGPEEISDLIINMLTSRKDPGYNKFPLIFAIKYFKDDKSEKLIPHYTYGILQNPTVIYNSTDEGDNIIYLSLVGNKHMYKIGNFDWTNQKGDLAIVKTRKIVDVEKILKINNRDISNIQVPEEENIVNLYLGDSAYNFLAKASGFRD